MAGPFLFLYFYCNWFAVIPGHSMAGITEHGLEPVASPAATLVPAAARSGSPPHGRRTVRGDPGLRTEFLYRRAEALRFYPASRCAASEAEGLGRVERIASYPSR
jgi:hypothetical protein